MGRVCRVAYQASPAISRKSFLFVGPLICFGPTSMRTSALSNHVSFLPEHLANSELTAFGPEKEIDMSDLNRQPGVTFRL